jgi:hypothetical protein
VKAHNSENLSKTLRALARDMERNHQAPPRLEQALLTAFRARRAPSVWRRRLGIGAIAASVAFLIYSAVWMRRGMPLPPPVPKITAQQALPAPLVVESSEEPPPPRTPAVRPRPVSRPAPAAPVEVVTGFLPVPGGDPLEPLDRGRMVRARLPRSALTAFGLPMNEDRAAERVQADVLIGEDGLARAIRFVHYKGH